MEVIQESIFPLCTQSMSERNILWKKLLNEKKNGHEVRNKIWCLICKLTHMAIGMRKMK
jgi:hypothetical protein